MHHMMQLVKEVRVPYILDSSFHHQNLKEEGRILLLFSHFVARILILWQYLSVICAKYAL